MAGMVRLVFRNRRSMLYIMKRTQLYLDEDVWKALHIQSPGGGGDLSRSGLRCLRPGLSPFVGRCLEALAGSFKITMPRSGFILRQVGFSQSLGQIAANTNFFVVRYKARNRLTVLQKHKRNVLIVRAVNAVCKIARSFRDGYARFLHNLIIRLSAFPDCVNRLAVENHRLCM
jgi:hypothetical protein